MLKRCFVSILLLLALFSVSGVNVGQMVATAQESDCVIPSSGPWPPCATGEGSTPVPADPNCVIPASGPWPPCATGGNPSPGGCVIPVSGPWPPCATGGNTPPTSDPSCAIPSSGPWPPCATGVVVEPTPEPTDDPEMTPESEESPMPDETEEPTPESEESPMPDETEEPTPESEESPMPDETEEPTPESEESPMPDETEEPTPESEESPMPDETGEPTPEPEDTPEPDGEFAVTSTEFLDVTSRELKLRFSYVNMPEDYVPLFRVVDIDNCLEQCDNLNLLAEYPIIGNGGHPDPAENGTLTMIVAIDNLFCFQTYQTTRLILVMANHQMLIDTGSASVDYALEIPFEHTWCDD